jgi:hypothetical protein
MIHAYTEDGMTLAQLEAALKTWRQAYENAMADILLLEQHLAAARADADILRKTLMAREFVKRERNQEC